jgi:hypothetical protein
MAVDAVVNDIDFRPREPFEERLVRVVQHLVPLLEPFQLLGFGCPEGLRVFYRSVSGGFPVFQACLGDDVFGWVIDFTIHFCHFSVSLCYHKEPPPSE